MSETVQDGNTETRFIESMH